MFRIGGKDDVIRPPENAQNGGVLSAVIRLDPEIIV